MRKAAYGAGIDSHLYLQKFIQLTIHLMDQGERVDQWSETKYINYVVTKLDFKPEHRELVDDSKKFILHVARNRNLSLRTIERVMSTMALALAFCGKLNLPAEVLGGLCLLKNVDPDLFMKAKTGALTYEEVRTKLAFHVAPDAALSYLVQHGQYPWMYFTGHTVGVDTSHGEYQELRRWFGESSPLLVASVANEIIDRLQQAS